MTALVFPMDFRTSQKIDARYFTLEAGLSPLSASREPYALVGEWVVRHESISHLNHGRVGDPTERSLVYKVREILDSQARAANH